MKTKKSLTPHLKFYNFKHIALPRLIINSIQIYDILIINSIQIYDILNTDNVIIGKRYIISIKCIWILIIKKLRKCNSIIYAFHKSVNNQKLNHNKLYLLLNLLQDQPPQGQK